MTRRSVALLVLLFIVSFCLCTKAIDVQEVIDRVMKQVNLEQERDNWYLGFTYWAEKRGTPAYGRHGKYYESWYEGEYQKLAKKCEPEKKVVTEKEIAKLESVRDTNLITMGEYEKKQKEYYCANEPRCVSDQGTKHYKLLMQNYMISLVLDTTPVYVAKKRKEYQRGYDYYVELFNYYKHYQTHYTNAAEKFSKKGDTKMAQESSEVAEINKGKAEKAKLSVDYYADLLKKLGK